MADAGKAMAAHYHRHARSQRVAVELMMRDFDAAVIAALQTIPPGQTAFRVLDLGVADGVNTGELVDVLLRRTRELAQIVDIELGLLDLPENNWAVLAASSREWVSAATAAGLRLHVRMAPQSFYEALAPPRSLDVVWACTALHWSAGTGDAEGELDTVLQRVADSLRPGGTFVATTPSVVPAELPGQPPLRRWWHRDLVAASAVPSYRALLPAFQRSVHSWSEAVWRKHLSSPAASAVFDVHELRSVDIEDVYWRDATDAIDYAREHTASFEVVMDGMLRLLDGKSDVKSERQKVLAHVSAAAQSAYESAQSRGDAPAVQHDGLSVVVFAVRRG